jgi:hypothetical protein
VAGAQLPAGVRSRVIVEGLGGIMTSKVELQNRLRAMLGRIFADGVVEPRERDELRALFREGALSVPEVRAAFASFVDESWGKMMEDGVLEPHERQKLRAIVEGLKLPDDCIPDAVKAALVTA